MSRSKRSTPVVGHTTAASEKSDKVFAHRHGRHAAKARLGVDPQSGAELDKEHRRSGDWTFAKDGRQWLGARHRELLRK